MFKIDPAQLDALRAERLSTFIEQTVMHLQTRFPKEAGEQSDESLRALVRLSIDRGRPHGVTSAYDVERLSECLLLYGTDFSLSDETRWARDILGRDDLSGREKLTAISNYEIFESRPSE